jgi:hypothetical protein
MSWESDYKAVLRTPPEGLLTTRCGEEVKINVDLVEGKAPFVYAVAYVHNVVGEEPAWYLQAVDHNEGHGWKAIILPRSRQEYMADPQPIYSLRVVRVSQSGKSLLVELV